MTDGTMGSWMEFLRLHAGMMGRGPLTAERAGVGETRAMLNVPTFAINRTSRDNRRALP